MSATTNGVKVNTSVPRSDVDFNRPGFAADPYPELASLQEEGPLFWHEESQEYLVTGHRNTARILGNAKSFTSDHDFFVGLFGGATMEAMDSPRHEEVRSIWARDFQRASLEEQRDLVSGVVEAQMRPYVDKLKSGQTVDAVTGMVRGIPTLVIAKLLGIPAEKHAQFSRWSDAMGGIVEGFSDPTPRGQKLITAGRAATQALNDFIRSELAVRQSGSAMEPGLISQMTQHAVAARMSESEIVASNTQLVFAGNETTAKLMTLTLRALALHPEQQQMVKQDRSLIPAVIEETHRWNTVVQRARRVLRNGGANVAGYDLPDGAVVTCLQGIANRDPDRWENPEAFDISRPGKQHLGFGFGLHSCLGLNLARLEVQILLDRLLDELTAWEIDGDVEWGTNWVLRGPLRLPLRATSTIRSNNPKATQ